MTALTIWMTGLSGAGKSTLAQAALVEAQRRWGGFFVLDGDVVRSGLCKDLGFSTLDRRENIRRVAEVARLMNLSGVSVICALISPLRVDREMARDIVTMERFVEVHIAASLDVCEQRDPKGLYRLARAGQVLQFTGIDSVYEPPEAPQLRLDTGHARVADCVAQLISSIEVKRLALSR